MIIFLMLHVHVHHMSSAAVAQWIRAFAPKAEVWVFESQPRQTQLAKTGSDSSTAKRSALWCECHTSSEMTYKRMPRVTEGMAR